MVAAAKPLAMFSRHTLLDGHPFGYVHPPGDHQGSAQLGGWPQNQGDVYVGKALAELVDCSEYFVITREAQQRSFDFVNENCGAVVVLAQNALRRGWFEEHLPTSYLRKIKIPVILLSLGVQFRFNETIELTANDVASLQALHDMCEFSQLRGNTSAQLLADNGIFNTKVLGCPSILSGNRDLDAVDTTRSGYLLTDMGAIPEIHSWQFGLMRQLQQRSKHFEVVTQGGEFVLQDYLSVRDGATIDRHSLELFDHETRKFVPSAQLRIGTLEDSGADLARITSKRLDLQEFDKQVRWYYREAPVDLVETMLRNAITYNDVAELRRHARKWGFALSSRLHGGILSLNEGVPTAFAVHDYRLKELVELYEFPGVQFGDGGALTNDWFANQSWPNLPDLRKRVRSQFAEFFDANGVAHLVKD